MVKNLSKKLPSINIQELLEEYKRFLVIKGVAKDTAAPIQLSPSALIEQVWHQHLLHTAKYREEDEDDEAHNLSGTQAMMLLHQYLQKIPVDRFSGLGHPSSSLSGYLATHTPAAPQDTSPHPCGGQGQHNSMGRKVSHRGILYKQDGGDGYLYLRKDGDVGS